MCDDRQTVSRAAGSVTALAEVTIAFALMHVAFRLFKSQTAIGQAEVRTGLNYSAGAAMVLVAVAFILVHRGRFRDYGLTLRGLVSGLNLGLLVCFVCLAVAGVAFAAGLRHDTSRSNPTVGLSACVLNLFASLIVLAVLRRAKIASARWPKQVATTVAIGSGVAPFAAYLIAAGSVGLTTFLTVIIIIWASLSEEVFFRGYMQSRLNMAFGRRWRWCGIAFGPGLFITAAYFGLVHLLNTFDYFHWQGRLAWWWGLPTACTLYYGLLREKTGGIAAPALVHVWLNTGARIAMLTGGA